MAKRGYLAVRFAGGNPTAPFTIHVRGILTERGNAWTHFPGPTTPSHQAHAHADAGADAQHRRHGFAAPCHNLRRACYHLASAIQLRAVRALARGRPYYRQAVWRFLSG